MNHLYLLLCTALFSPGIITYSYSKSKESVAKHSSHSKSKESVEKHSSHLKSKESVAKRASKKTATESSEHNSKHAARSKKASTGSMGTTEKIVIAGELGLLGAKAISERAKPATQNQKSAQTAAPTTASSAKTVSMVKP